MSEEWVRTATGIEALVPGFLSAQERIMEYEMRDAGGEELQTFIEWFEEEGRRARVCVHPNGNASVSVYEGTGQYCDEWRFLAGKGWLHAESGTFLDTVAGLVRDATDSEQDGL